MAEISSKSSSRFSDLPFDILVSILQFLPTEDGLALSSTSLDIRMALYPFLFSHVRVESESGKQAFDKAMENGNLALLNAIRKFTIAYHDGAPHLLRICFDFSPLSFKQLEAIITLLKVTQLQELVVELDSFTDKQSITGLPYLKHLEVHFDRDVDERSPSTFNPDDFLWPFINPSIDTLEFLSLGFSQIGQGVDISRLAPAVRMRTFHLKTNRDDSNVISVLPSVLPNLEDLTLRVKVDNPPMYHDSYVASFAQFRNLQNLTLNLDLDRIANDRPRKNDLEFFNRSLCRRISPTDNLVAACKALKLITWDISYSTEAIIYHPFGVVETPAGRVVKIGWNWWMGDSFRQRRRPLPEGIVNLDPAKNARMWNYHGP
ncbi:hypothetical protein D9615_003222 [Tricholomella constricta]|uniref:F-box domain-containing protein n=1 Tax=Tricholomella constricta TaxID=117010 RepID=A0A8H5HJ78_9AGAR|nr:hypothetical protein D9615_003222 [Tricholomella constricta]